MEDWKRMAAEAKTINDDLLSHMKAGAAATASEVVALAEEHRQHIDRWFYDCTLEIHVGLAEMYVVDPRFAKNYDEQAPGFARYIADAIRANAEMRAA